MVSALFLVSLMGAEEGPTLDRVLGSVHPAVCAHLLPQCNAPLAPVVAATLPAVLVLLLCQTELLDSHASDEFFDHRLLRCWRRRLSLQWPCDRTMKRNTGK